MEMSKQGRADFEGILQVTAGAFCTCGIFGSAMDDSENEGFGKALATVAMAFVVPDTPIP